MFLTDISFKRPVLATVCIFALIALGVINFFQLDRDEFPPAEYPYVTVTIVQPGASPEQIESNIAKQVEDAMGQVAGVKHINSTCRDGVDVTFAEFTLETPVAEAVQNVRDKIGLIRSSLPAGCEEPVIASYDPAAEPVVSLAMTGDVSLREMSVYVDDIVKPKLETINGVGSVDVYGAEDREIHINLDQAKLAQYGLTTSEILNNLKATNLDSPAGKISQGENEYSLRTSGSLDQLAQFSQIVAARRAGQPIYLGDIATVEDGIKDKDSIAYYQGNPAIGIDIVKQSGTNTVQVADKVMAAYAEISKQLPSNVSLDIVKDNSINIRDSVNDVLKTIVEGAILAVLTVLLFLGNWRTTLISAIAIPTSVISSFTIMKLLNFSLNIMSLTALSLSVGLLIDDAIVVIENIERHRKMGKPILTAVMDAISEIGLAVVATTFSLVAVFLPVGMLTGVVGQFFKQFGITVVASVLISLLVSFTLVPLLSARHLKNGEIELPVSFSWFQKIHNRFYEGFERLARFYERLLTYALGHRKRIVALAAGLFAGSLVLALFLGTDFIPKADMSKMNITIVPDSGLSQDAIGQEVQTADKMLHQHKEVIKTYATVSGETVNMYVELTDRNKRSKSIGELAGEFRSELKTIPGIGLSVNPVSIGPTGNLKNIEYNIVGDNDAELQQYAEKLQNILESLPGVVDVSNSYKPGNPETQIVIDQDKASDLGVLPAQAADTLYTLYSGVVVGQYNDGQDRVDIRVRLDAKDRDSLDNLNLVTLQSTSTGQMIPLSAFTKEVFAPSASVITRYDKQEKITLSANANGAGTGEINKEFLSRAEKEVPAPTGCKIVEGKMTEMMNESLSGMSLALIMGIMFIVFILAAQFESYIDPLAVLLSLPLAVIGAVLGLLVMGSNLNLISLIGIIMLMGLVTKNAILLIEFARQEMRRGTDCTQALILSGKTRMRPIIMTTMAMILGMIPMALGIGTGGEARAPMAYAIIGGLITSTMLTLIVVPVLYSIIQDVKRKVRK